MNIRDMLSHWRLLPHAIGIRAPYFLLVFSWWNHKWLQFKYNSDISLSRYGFGGYATFFIDIYKLRIHLTIGRRYAAD